ncbi:hypothetical protein BDZ94DRAFT_1170740 [Collybia nuda]|uniref:MARVEL domain-containing protein n=1 Tax=Collybia nuda TaxID=64659 RepID=A0A9P5Y293_9AGAR|nr:hypothetical protein BDZ94DRAFT_1170740 [Collybia nuda]
MEPISSNGEPLRKKSFVKAHYHPFLFSMMTFSAMAELGLTAFLISAGNENRTWPSGRYHSLLILFLFNSVWTAVFSTSYMIWTVDGASYFLASVASSVIWLVVTCILWGVASGIMHNTRSGGNCAGRATISRSVEITSQATPESKYYMSRCRQSLTVEALGWTEFGLCVLTMVATCLWVRTSGRRCVGDSRRFV